MSRLISLLIIFALLFSFIVSSSFSQMSSDTETEKYKRVDIELKKIQSNLPKFCGEIWIWLSVAREENTVEYELVASDSYKGEFDHQFHKEFWIENIQKEKDLMADQMDFRLIYFLPHGRKEIINITSKEYMVKNN